MAKKRIWVYNLANLHKLVFTDFDSAQLFVFHNQYVADGTAVSERP